MAIHPKFIQANMKIQLLHFKFYPAATVTTLLQSCSDVMSYYLIIHFLFDFTKQWVFFCQIFNCNSH